MSWHAGPLGGIRHAGEVKVDSTRCGCRSDSDAPHEFSKPPRGFPSDCSKARSHLVFRLDLFSETMTGMDQDGNKGRKLWFENGFWWYRGFPGGGRLEISGLMKACRFDACTLSSSLGVNDRTFRRLVIESLGIPPGIWLRQQRAVAVRYRLREGIPVKQVAMELGFRHAGDFCVEFKRWHGLGPVEFVHKTRNLH